MKLIWYCKGNWVGVVVDDWKDMVLFILLSFSCLNFWGNDVGEKNWLFCNFWLFLYCMFWWKLCLVDNVDYFGGFNVFKSCCCWFCFVVSGLYVSFGFCVVFWILYLGSGEKFSIFDLEFSFVFILDWGLLFFLVFMCRVFVLVLLVEDDCILK